jgi:hypothetical protein
MKKIRDSIYESTKDAEEHATLLVGIVENMEKESMT